MSLTRATVRRPLPVTLRQVPANVRFSAAQREARSCTDADEALDLIAAATFPTSTVYYVAESARPMLERWAA